MLLQKKKNLFLLFVGSFAQFIILYSACICCVRCSICLYGVNILMQDFTTCGKYDKIHGRHPWMLSRTFFEVQCILEVLWPCISIKYYKVEQNNVE